MPVRRSSNHIPSSPAGINQGIVTILGADCDQNSKAGSIRKTLSADMSSKKWLEQNGFLSPMKKIVSSQEIVMEGADHSSNSSSSESEEEFEENPNQDDIWRSIQSKKEQKPAQNDGVWSSILTQKTDNSLLPPPYVFTPVKRSASSLSEKSLEICTESLGSETGSDRFSSYGEKEGLIDGDEQREAEEKQRSQTEEVRGEDPFADLHVVKYKNSPVRPFPPPLPSMAGSGGASLHMHSHRENGRLVLEAVSVAPRNYFNAQRKDGRLVLTLMHGQTTHAEEEEEEKVFGDMEDVEEEEDEDEERESGGKKQEFVMEQNLSLPTGMISVHKSGLVMKKLVAVGNINPKWSNKFNKGDDLLTAGDGEMEQLPIPQSLPPRPPVVARLIASPPPPAAASFNPYEYFWRSKPTIPANKTNQDLASKTEQFVPYVRGCKEARRSLIWEPFCIATS